MSLKDSPAQLFTDVSKPVPFCKELMLSGYTQITQMVWLSVLVFIILSTLCVYIYIFFSLASLENSLFQEPNS